TWPSCTATTIHSGTDVHGLIEFGNRVLSVAVFLAGIALLALVVLRQQRRDLYVHVAGLFAGYLAEAVLGGVSVLTRLDPLVVAAHFLLAIALLWVAIVIWRRLGSQPVAPAPTVGPELRWLGRGLVAAAFAILVVGTLVTGTGPHAGSRVDNRLALDRHDITTLHSDLVLLVVGAVAVTMVLLRLTGAPALLRRRARTLLVVMLIQSGVGFVQYFTGLPAWLVGVHVVGATAFWAASLLLALDMYARPAATPIAPAAPSPADRSLASA
ncbi:MAG TPA: COX15/CtaA family protein, partial [Mycobacteriales bacterium]|nr:COX15/CtaA family protein [Mycobacteriales bacterium]